MLTKTKKKRVIDKVKQHDEDTGSPEVQISLLTKRIDELTSHLKKHKKDLHSRRGLLQLVAKRQRHMKYLEQTDKKRFANLIKSLNLKKKVK